MKHVVITTHSVWLVEQSSEGALFIEDRATFGSPFIADGRRFSGPVEAGTLTPGDSLTFRNESEGGGFVSTGAIVRVVAFEDEPEAPSEGIGADGIRFIRLVPSWSWLLPFVSSSAREDAQRAFDVADLLAELNAMGRINAHDITAANDRIRSRRAQTS